MRRLAPLLPLLALGCTTPAGSVGDPAPNPVQVVSHTRIQIDRADLHGASGLAMAPSGHLFTVLERDHQVFELKIEEPDVQVLSARAVIGAPSGVDLEALAVIDDTHLAFGTETTRTDRTGDLILFAELTQDAVQVTGEVLALDYAPWGITPERNRGIEGLCHAAGVLVAAVETVGVQDGQRFAPIAAYDLLQRTWTYHRVALTTETGKIAGLSCRTSPTGIEVLAIERHYEVSRIVQFTLPRVGIGQNIVPSPMFDMGPLFEGAKIPNFEGLAVLPDGRWVSISDNDYGGVSGPTELLILPAPTQAAGHRGQRVR